MSVGRLHATRSSAALRAGLGATLVAMTLAGAPRPVASAAPIRATPVIVKVREHRARHEGAILREFAELLRIPNVASDSVNIRRNADLLVTMLERRGMSARRLELAGSPPAVYGELRTPGARRTVVLYAHYDGQPVALKDWASDPWTPVLRDRPVDQGGREVSWPAQGGTFDPEWRLYARSAGDDKAPVAALLAALDALAAAKAKPSVNLKVFLEGEEEAGSPHLRAMLERHRELLAADAWIFCDGPMHPSRRPQLVFGVRGVMGLELTVYGPRRAVHSGHYGNWAPNPVVRMNELLASLRDGDGRILVAGFDQGVRPVSDAERAALRATPDPDDALRGELQLGGTEGGGASLGERIMLPAINLRGVRAGGVGESAVNAIPTEARASIDFRLVPDQTPAGVRAAIEDHLRAKGWHIVAAAPDSATRRAHERIVRLEWDDGYGPYRVPLDAPFPRAVAQVMEASLGRPVLLTPTLGGSLPLAVMGEALGVPIIVMPIANHDNNQHAANENLRLQNLWDGIDVMAGLLVLLGDRWR
jgi:acetylornithine deacetylase/succinyl-diaminopimelate desuccinylase-like protein